MLPMAVHHMVVVRTVTVVVFVLVAVHREAVTRSRLTKPEIPLIGANGIPLRDEIELELDLSSGNA